MAFKQWLNWRTALVCTAILIVSGTIIYSQYLSKKISSEEKQKIEQWADAVKTNSNPDITDNSLAIKILVENSKDIPIIYVNEKGILLDARNVDSTLLLNDKNYLPKKIKQYLSLHPAIEWKNPLDSTQINKVYYGESALLNEVRYYPIIQLIIVALFIIIMVVAQRTNYKSTQNQIWAGMAKETAHQLGTPVTSLEGWLELLKEVKGNEKIVPEIEKDINRLLLITDRFGKIGSKPNLEKTNLIALVESTMDYIKRRAGNKVKFQLVEKVNPLMVMLSPPLFEWILENLLKNALDAMEGKGSIIVQVDTHGNKIIIDVIDTGKGISNVNISKVFNPGFTTKKRGWGLGLSLAKRIVEQYHNGKIFVLHSEPNKGTTFRVVLNQ